MSHSARQASLKVFLLALSVYGVSAQFWSHAVSLAPHYIYLAYSLLHRHVDLIQLPPTTYDLLQHNGQWFVAGSPMPALLMLPFVAIFGVGFSDVLFSVIVGALDVALVYSLLGALARGSVPTDQPPAQPSQGFGLAISESARRWITLLFAVGTPFWYLASLSTYWFTAHVVVVLFTLLATREALTRQRWFLVGLWLACAGFARPTALFLAPFFWLIMFYRPHSSRRASLVTRCSLRALALFSFALVIGVSAHLVYNYARFKSFTDFGYAYVTGAPNITGVYERYGGFNPRFVPCNLAVSLLAPPEVNGTVPSFVTQSCAYLLEGVNLSDASAFVTPDPLGMSIFFATPALLIVFLSLKPAGVSNSRHESSSADRRPAPLVLAAWTGLLTTLIPLWFYHNTGSLQFGWRYLFDATPMWIILLAAGLQKVTRLKQGLILVSIAINLWGFLWMFEKLNGVSWWK